MKGSASVGEFVRANPVRGRGLSGKNQELNVLVVITRVGFDLPLPAHVPGDMVEFVQARSKEFVLGCCRAPSDAGSRISGDVIKGAGETPLRGARIDGIPPYR